MFYVKILMAGKTSSPRSAKMVIGTFTCHGKLECPLGQANNRTAQILLPLMVFENC